MPIPSPNSSNSEKQSRGVGHLLKKLLTGSDFFLFLFFLLVSASLWLMLTLNPEYDDDVDIPVVIKNIPKDSGFSGTGDNVLNIKVHDSGASLINYYFYSFQPISVDYNELINNNGRLSLPVSSLRKSIEGRLQSTTKVLSVSPDTLYYYTRESAVRFPVRIDTELSAARQYMLGKPMLIPDSVWVYAPRDVADTLRYIQAASVNVQELRDTLVKKVALLPIKNVICVPGEVELVVPVSPYAERVFDVPLITVGAPENRRLRTFPSHVKIMVNVGMAQYNSVSKYDFRVGVDFAETVESDAPRLKVHLLDAPPGVKDVRVVPSEVEYFIEEI